MTNHESFSLTFTANSESEMLERMTSPQNEQIIWTVVILTDWACVMVNDGQDSNLLPEVP